MYTFYMGTSDMYLIFINITLKLTLESLVTCKILILIASLTHATGGREHYFEILKGDNHEILFTVNSTTRKCLKC